MNSPTPQCSEEDRGPREVSERFILFTGAMVRAILTDRKTNTRRVLSPQPEPLQMPDHYDWRPRKGVLFTTRNASWYPIERAFHEEVSNGHCPYGTKGDRLRVKEAAWMWCHRVPDGVTKRGRQKWRYVPVRSVAPRYVADHPTKPHSAGIEPVGEDFVWRYKSARFLPSWASRITLEIVRVRVERLQKISDADARAEGWGGFMDSCVGDGFAGNGPRTWFRKLWDLINAERGYGWDSNPYVWVIEFKRV